MADGSQGSSGARRPRSRLALRAAILVLLSAAAAGCVDGGLDAVAVGSEKGTVSRVGDGDTLDVRSGQRVRLVQIDAPELGEGECYAQEARRELLQLAPPGVRVDLHGDPELDDRDRYGRLLRYVVASGRNVNVELVRRGAAAPYFRGGDEGIYADELLDAVDTARADGRGMWGACRVDWTPDRAVVTRSR